MIKLIIKHDTQLLKISGGLTYVTKGEYVVNIIPNPWVKCIEDKFFVLNDTEIGASKRYIRENPNTFELITSS